MLRYTTDRARPGLVALYDIWPGNGAGQFLQPRSPQGAFRTVKQMARYARDNWFKLPERLNPGAHKGPLEL